MGWRSSITHGGTRGVLLLSHYPTAQLAEIALCGHLGGTALSEGAKNGWKANPSAKESLCRG